LAALASGLSRPPARARDNVAFLPPPYEYPEALLLVTVGAGRDDEEGAGGAADAAAADGLPGADDDDGPLGPPNRASRFDDAFFL
jgi:hypothetical protein